MKRVTFSLLMALIVVIMAFAGCNNDTGNAGNVGENVKEDVKNAQENVENKANKEMGFILMKNEEVPERIKEIADKSAGKELFLSVKHDGAFYGILSHKDTAKRYVVDSVESHTIAISDFITVNLKEEAASSGNGSVTIYRADQMLDLEGVAFQMADNPAIASKAKDKKVKTEEVSEGAAKAANADAEGLDLTPTKIMIASPSKDSVVEGGSCTIAGSLDGMVESVTCQLVTDGGKILGEKTSRVSDLSHEFNVKLNYTLSQTDKRGNDGAVDGAAKVTYTDGEGNVQLEASVPVKIK